MQEIFNKICKSNSVPEHISYQGTPVGALKWIMNNYNIDPSYGNNSNIIYACINGNVDILDLLYNHHKVNTPQNIEKITSVIVRVGNFNILEYIITKTDTNYKKNTLHERLIYDHNNLIDIFGKYENIDDIPEFTKEAISLNNSNVMKYCLSNPSFVKRGVISRMYSKIFDIDVFKLFLSFLKDLTTANIHELFNKYVISKSEDVSEYIMNNYYFKMPLKKDLGNNMYKKYEKYNIIKLMLLEYNFNQISIRKYVLSILKNESDIYSLIYPILDSSSRSRNALMNKIINYTIPYIDKELFSKIMENFKILPRFHNYKSIFKELVKNDRVDLIEVIIKKSLWKITKIYDNLMDVSIIYNNVKCLNFTKKFLPTDLSRNNNKYMLLAYQYDSINVVKYLFNIRAIREFNNPKINMYTNMIQFHNTEILTYMVANSAYDPTLNDHNAISLAMNSGNYKSTLILLNDKRVNPLYNNGNTVLHIIKHYSTDAISDLLKHPKTDKNLISNTLMKVIVKKCTNENIDIVIEELGQYILKNIYLLSILIVRFPQYTSFLTKNIKFLESPSSLALKMHVSSILTNNDNKYNYSIINRY